MIVAIFPIIFPLFLSFCYSIIFGGMNENNFGEKAKLLFEPSDCIIYKLIASGFVAFVTTEIHIFQNGINALWLHNRYDIYFKTSFVFWLGSCFMYDTCMHWSKLSILHEVLAELAKYGMAIECLVQVKRHVALYVGILILAGIYDIIFFIR